MSNRTIPARVIHQFKVVFHLEKDDEGRNDLSNRKSGQGVLVAHDQQLTHLDHGLKLTRLVASRLKS